jgi:hypothetical protein
LWAIEILGGILVSCLVVAAYDGKFDSPLLRRLSVSGLVIFLIILTVSHRMPNCPGCHNTIDARFDRFCPECGNASLRPGKWQLPHCSTCGKDMKIVRGGKRLYKIRACTFCGLMLDEQGL